MPELPAGPDRRPASQERIQRLTRRRGGTKKLWVAGAVARVLAGNDGSAAGKFCGTQGCRPSVGTQAGPGARTLTEGAGGGTVFRSDEGWEAGGVTGRLAGRVGGGARVLAGGPWAGPM